MARLLVLGASLWLSGAAYADAVDDWIKAAMAKDHVPGVGVALVRPDGSADYRTYGFASLEFEVPYARTTVHRIASVSKQFCAYAILKLAKDGKLSLDDPLSKFFPKGPQDWSKIKVRHMLSHRSGIAEPERFDYRREYTADEFVTLLSSKPLAEEPGSTYRYNNFAYGLLGMIVGVASGEPIEKYVKQWVFDPVGMSATRYFEFDAVVPQMSGGYRWQNGRYVLPLNARPRMFHGSGGILSTLTDMVKYEVELRRPKVLDAEILKQQWTVYDGSDRGYGFGWHVDRRGPEPIVAHTGSTFGFTTAIHRELKSGWTVILFRNSQTTEIGPWAREILRLAKGENPLPPKILADLS